MPLRVDVSILKEINAKAEVVQLLNCIHLQGPPSAKERPNCDSCAQYTGEKKTCNYDSIERRHLKTPRETKCVEKDAAAENENDCACDQFDYVHSGLLL